MACGRNDVVAQMNRCNESMENWLIELVSIGKRFAGENDLLVAGKSHPQVKEGNDHSLVQHLHVREAEDPFLVQENEKGLFL